MQGDTNLQDPHLGNGKDARPLVSHFTRPLAFNSNGALSNQFQWGP